MNKHEWILDVFKDLVLYAKLNNLTGFLERIKATLPTLETEIGIQPKLVELFMLFDLKCSAEFDRNHSEHQRLTITIAERCCRNDH